MNWQNSYISLIKIVVLALLSSACTPIVPATTPPQLEHTAGSPITIVDNRITTESFYVTIPDGWRVVTSVANAPVELVIVSPDDEMVIRIAQVGEQCDLPQPTPEPTLYTSQQCVGETTQLLISGEAPIAQQTTYNQFFANMVDSIIFR